MERHGRGGGGGKVDGLLERRKKMKRKRETAIKRAGRNSCHVDIMRGINRELGDGMERVD